MKTIAPKIIKCLLFFSFINNADAQTVVNIGQQKWMTQNLDVVKFSNGDTIPQAQTDEDWQKAGFSGKPAWCYYHFDGMETRRNQKQLGRLYNVYAIKDPRGIAPKGWHLPTVEEWKTLENTLNSGALGLIDILSDANIRKDKNGTNKTGMNIILAGWRDVGFGGFGDNTSFWCGDVEAKEGAPYVSINYFDGTPTIRYNTTTWIMGFYIRCVKD